MQRTRRSEMLFVMRAQLHEWLDKNNKRAVLFLFYNAAKNLLGTEEPFETEGKIVQSWILLKDSKCNCNWLQTCEARISIVTKAILIFGIRFYKIFETKNNWIDVRRI